MRRIKHFLTAAPLVMTFVMTASGCGKESEEQPVVNTETATMTQPVIPPRSRLQEHTEIKSTGRELYPDISFIETADVKADFLDHILVDVRSNFEYRTIHMLDAVSIPASDSAFIARLRNLVRKYKPTVVLYANGGKDRSAHEAARIATKEKIDNVFVYDGSIQDWAIDFPELTLLRGNEISDENQLIDEELYAAKLLNDDSFRTNLTADDGVLLDIRDSSDITRHPLQAIAVVNPLDHKESLETLFQKVKIEDRPLFIFDDYGLKSRWLMYQLDHLEIDNFYFLKDGLLN